MIDFLWQFFSIFGEAQFWIGVAFASMIIYVLASKPAKKYIEWFVFGVLPAAVVSSAITEGLKLLFKIPRPCAGLSFCETGYSFPSAHAALIFAAMTVAIMYSKSMKLSFLFFSLALLVSLSRVFLGVHRIQDVIAGGLIGFAVGYFVYKNYEKILQKIKLRQ
jgi:membrane-associated phospholipid phosphatase